MTDVLVVSDLSDGKPRKSALSAVNLAKKVAEGTGGAFDILLIGEGASGAGAEMAGYGARKVFTTDVAGGYLAEKYAPTIAERATAGGYGVVTGAASTTGKDLLPRVAAKLSAGLVSDILAVEIDGGTLKYRRSMYAGNVLATVTVTTPMQIVSVRQSEFEAAEATGGSSPIEAVAAASDPTAERIEFLGLDVVKSERPDLAEADCVVSGGRGLKSADNFANVLEPLADALGAAIGASRAACDSGYVSSDLQVGQTGKVVSPKLYFAVAISGAIQHVAGMKGSKTIVAINTNNEAPIAQVADYFLVADLFEVLPTLTEEIKKLKAAG